MNLESIKDRPLSKKMEERLLYMYQAHNLKSIKREWLTFPPLMIVLCRREMVDSHHAMFKDGKGEIHHTFEWTVNEKGINYLKSKGLI